MLRKKKERKNKTFSHYHLWHTHKHDFDCRLFELTNLIWSITPENQRSFIRIFILIRSHEFPPQWCQWISHLATLFLSFLLAIDREGANAFGLKIKKVLCMITMSVEPRAGESWTSSSPKTPPKQWLTGCWRVIHGLQAQPNAPHYMSGAMVAPRTLFVSHIHCWLWRKVKIWDAILASHFEDNFPRFTITPRLRSAMDATMIGAIYTSWKIIFNVWWWKLCPRFFISHLKKNIL